jgi:hypothetical protein
MKDKYAKVFVCPSGIQGAGHGLYAARAIAADEVICPYEGELLDDAEFEERYKDSAPEYAVPVPDRPDMSIDPRDCKWALGRFANGSDHPKTWWKYAANATLCPSEKRAMGVDLVAIVPIKVCDEILIEYGPDYWSPIADACNECGDEECSKKRKYSVVDQ